MYLQDCKIIGNWKMHKTLKESKAYMGELLPLLNGSFCGLAVPYLFLAPLSELVSEKIAIGAQNMSDEKKGAFTGEISIDMLKEAKTSFVLLGHSERRNFFKEDSAMIGRKVHLALQANLNAILCVGETLEEKIQGKTYQVIHEQLTLGLSKVSLDKISYLTLAYEPVWAIGKNTPASLETIAEIHTLCQNLVTEILGLSQKFSKVMYGGSVNDSNTKQILSLPSVEGLLVGGASLDPKSFAKIVQMASFKEES